MLLCIRIFLTFLIAVFLAFHHADGKAIAARTKRQNFLSNLAGLFGGGNNIFNANQPTTTPAPSPPATGILGALFGNTPLFNAQTGLNSVSGGPGGIQSTSNVEVSPNRVGPVGFDASAGTITVDKPQGSGSFDLFGKQLVKNTDQTDIDLKNGKICTKKGTDTFVGSFGVQNNCLDLGFLKNIIPSPNSNTASNGGSAFNFFGRKRK